MIVGAARAVADGSDCSYICDVVVDSQYQGLGLGRRLIENLLEQSKDHKKVILYANPGKEGFYGKLGFYKLNTAMAIFRYPDKVLESGVISKYSDGCK